MNPLLSLLGGSGNIMLKAFGAAMRGESPEAFMKNLAATEPRLKGLDLDNLETTANKLAADKNVSISDLTAKVKSEISSYM